jgi:hypothetical protein
MQYGHTWGEGGGQARRPPPYHVNPSPPLHVLDRLDREDDHLQASAHGRTARETEREERQPIEACMETSLRVVQMNRASTSVHAIGLR